MNLKIVIFLILFFPFQVLAEGRMYTGSAEGHCTEWSNKLLKWPQTSVGREASKCRIRAKKHSDGPVTCRLKKVSIDKETGMKMCLYYRQGRNVSDKTVSISPSLKCQRSFDCKRY
jgi:hypothetical protein|tara:strand:- start:759 stop:1106 length:348 start_codon:yes stop_codon:yes gene_type:complete